MTAERPGAEDMQRVHLGRQTPAELVKSLGIVRTSLCLAFGRQGQQARMLA